jgi:hypothetical protein
MVHLWFRLKRCRRESYGACAAGDLHDYECKTTEPLHRRTLGLRM